MRSLLRVLSFSYSRTRLCRIWHSAEAQTSLLIPFSVLAASPSLRLYRFPEVVSWLTLWLACYLNYPDRVLEAGLLVNLYTSHLIFPSFAIVILRHPIPFIPFVQPDLHLPNRPSAALSLQPGRNRTEVALKADIHRSFTAATFTSWHHHTCQYRLAMSTNPCREPPHRNRQRVRQLHTWPQQPSRLRG